MKSKKTIGFLLKISIVVLALFFLYKQVTSKVHVEQFNIDYIFNQLKEKYLVIGLVILMMFLNSFGGFCS